MSFWSSNARLDRIERKLDDQSRLIITLIQKDNKLMSELSDLTAEVAAVAQTEAAAVAVIQDLVAKVAAASAANDGPALVALTAQLKAQTDTLAAALPVAPAPVAAPVVEPVVAAAPVVDPAAPTA